ncbi:hypothetical protein H0I29_00705 [Polaribacter sp. R2A056_3_33]|uniref:hypothetical protein n=1 Tax=Polaribacter sp. R2A056_3_33 TaxID=2745563 RepID=UPI001C4F8BA8|nr:hypothetical protein [Polaribacter sp. R2A056_3_33]QXP70662.1 hypothetical protein H0I29_00705 [Polaribacter sp. R2A056_3_33]
MNNTEINSLEKKISISDVITMIAIFLTLGASIFSFTYKGKLNDLLKKEKQTNELIIAKAEESSETAKRDAAIANEKSMIAMKNAADANMKTAEINERAINAELKSKKLEIELIKLRLDVGDRFLPIEIQKELIKELAKYPKKTIAIFVNIANNSEPNIFANNLKNFFTKLGWDSNIYQQNNVIVPPPTGMQIIGKTECIPILEIFGKHLKSMNYENKLSNNDSLETDLRIVIFSNK